MYIDYCICIVYVNIYVLIYIFLEPVRVIVILSTSMNMLKFRRQKSDYIISVEKKRRIKKLYITTYDLFNIVHDENALLALYSKKLINPLKIRLSFVIEKLQTYDKYFSTFITN